MKRTIFAALICFFAAFALLRCASSKSPAQKEIEAQKIRQEIESFRFTFNATYAYPTGYRSINLSPYYTLKMSKDTVQAYLPYYGRAYTAPLDPSEGGIKFVSTNFEYKVSEGKQKGNWRIEIKPKDVRKDMQLSLDVWENGNARLNVNSTDRQPISFQGNIE